MPISLDFTPRLVASDIDGTILPATGAVSRRTRDVFARSVDSGLDVVLVTGRPPRWLPAILRQTGLTGPVIAANGAMVVSGPTLEPIEVHPIPREAAYSAVELLRAAVPDAVFAAETPAGLRATSGYLEARGREQQAPAQRGVTVVTSTEELLAAGPVVKLVTLSDALDPDKFLRIGREQVGHLLTVTRSSVGRALLELGPPGVTKASTLADLARSRGIPLTEVVAFGDMPNDVEMLRSVGRGFAMSGGHPEALAAADATAPPVHEDGVAQVVERILTARPPHPAPAPGVRTRR